MRPRLLISAVSCLLFLITTPSLRAETNKWPIKIGDWTAQEGRPDVFSAPRLKDAEFSGIASESGFLTESSKSYTTSSGVVVLTLYTFKDSSGAYEAYTAIEPRAAKSGGSEAIVKGNLVLWIDADRKFSRAELKVFEGWAESISDHVASPPVAAYLPDKGKDPFTERYALGPVAFRNGEGDVLRTDALPLPADQIGFNAGAEAMFARYKNGKDEATLLLIEYPTPQLAELHLKHMQRAILALKTGTSVERKGSLLSIVLAPTSQEYAEKLRSAVNYETQVTWSEPSTTATDPPIMSTLVKIFIATGVFMVVTVVVGIAFGGVRIITKRLFPGKVFDRKNQIEVLQLGLSSKPIDPTDMY